MVGMGDSWANVLQSLISWAWVQIGVCRLSHRDEFETGRLYGIRMEFTESVAVAGRDISPTSLVNHGSHWCVVSQVGGRRWMRRRARLGSGEFL